MIESGLSVHLALDSAETAWARSVVEKHHYLHSWPHNQSRPMTYLVRHSNAPAPVGIVVVGIPHATRNRNWWGYDGLPTQWQTLDLSRIWLAPSVQRGGSLCRPGDRKEVWRPAVASFVIRQILDRVQVDRVSLWPPVYPDQPYHIRLVISYSDPAVHRGEIYRNGGARPLYRDRQGNPAPGPAGKVGWYWRLPEPEWSWDEIEILRPRTMRLGL